MYGGETNAEIDGMGRLFYAFFIPYFYIQIYADFRDVPPGIAHYLLAILNAVYISVWVRRPPPICTRSAAV